MLLPQRALSFPGLGHPEKGACTRSARSSLEQGCCARGQHGGAHSLSSGPALQLPASAALLGAQTLTGSLPVKDAQVQLSVTSPVWMVAVPSVIAHQLAAS